MNQRRFSSPSAVVVVGVALLIASLQQPRLSLAVTASSGSASPAADLPPPLPGTTEVISLDNQGFLLGMSFRPVVSPDGNVVAFETYEVRPDGSSSVQVYLRDLANSRTELISAGAQGERIGGSLAQISDSGDLVFFSQGKFVRDRRAGLTIPISLDPADADRCGPVSQDIYYPASPEGSYVLFGRCLRAWRDNMTIELPTIPSGTSPLSLNARKILCIQPSVIQQVLVQQVCVFDRATETSSLVSTTAAGVIGDRNSFPIAMSKDGTLVAFRSEASNLGRPAGAGLSLYIKDLVTGELDLVAAPFGQVGAVASFSANNRLLVFEYVTENAPLDVRLYDRLNRQTFLVSVTNAGQPADFYAQSPSVSADGSVVAFWSRAGNLADGPQWDRIFVRRGSPFLPGEPPGGGQFSVTHIRQLPGLTPQSVPSAPPGFVAHAFHVGGFDLTTLPLDWKLNHLVVSPSCCGWASTDEFNFILLMRPTDPAGQYNLVLELPDGRRASATFRHEPPIRRGIMYVHGIKGDSRNPGFDSLLLPLAGLYAVKVFEYSEDQGNMKDAGVCVRRSLPAAFDSSVMPVDVPPAGSTPICDSQDDVGYNAVLLDADITAFARERGLDHVTVVANSMGGAITRAFLTYAAATRSTSVDVVDSVLFLQAAHQGSYALLADACAGQSPTVALVVDTIASAAINSRLAVDRDRPAIEDLTPQSAMYVSANRLEGLPNSLRYANVASDIQLRPAVDLLLWQFPLQTISVGDYVLLPGSDDPTAIPPCGGARFMPSSVGRGLSSEQWTLPRVETIVINDVEVIGDLTRALDVPEAHWNFGSRMREISVSDPRGPRRLDLVLLDWIAGLDGGAP